MATFQGNEKAQHFGARSAMTPGAVHLASEEIPVLDSRAGSCSREYLFHKRGAGSKRKPCDLGCLIGGTEVCEAHDSLYKRAKPTRK